VSAAGRTLKDHELVAGSETIDQLHQLAGNLAGASVVHVNSTRLGGGVAEILHSLVPLMNELGLRTRWEVIEGNDAFFRVTRSVHNGLQGSPVEIGPEEDRAYRAVNEENAARLRPVLEAADFVIIHDPQPALLHSLCPKKKGKWTWRCHIDASRPSRSVWKFLRPMVAPYDASIFSMPAFAQPLPHVQFIIAPSIDPLTEKNIDLPPAEIEEMRRRFGLDPERPLLVQVSRFDRFKDPVGVIRAYRMVRGFAPAQLVLVGGEATDDPEGAEVLAVVRKEAAGDPDIHVLLLPGDAHRTINALQRAADIVLQKSTREGFGLTVTEALWKGRPVIGGETGGIRLQVVDHQTGFLVNTPEGAAHRIRLLLHDRDKMRAMGERGREFVRENFLITRSVREYLTLMIALRQGVGERLFATTEVKKPRPGKKKARAAAAGSHPRRGSPASGWQGSTRQTGG
jgi:trehalose synthase